MNPSNRHCGTEADGLLVGSEQALEKVKWEMGSRGINDSGPMIFREGFNGGKLQWLETIIAEGTIQPDTPQVFARFIAQKMPNGAVRFNLPGGNLLAGLKLGEMIRSAGLSGEMPHRRIAAD
jgi:hypothetical protein